MSQILKRGVATFWRRDRFLEQEIEEFFLNLVTNMFVIEAVCTMSKAFLSLNKISVDLQIG